MTQPPSPVSSPASGVADRPRSQLVRQLGFLHRSCELFDLGYQEEAIRIATTLRVLLHDGPKMRRGEGSILRHLGATGTGLVTTCVPRAGVERSVVYDGYVNLPGNLRPWASYLDGTQSTLPVPEWWDQIIFVVNHRPIRRRHLILVAANKDGGAHVDQSLTPEYEAAIGMWTMASPNGEGGMRVEQLTENHLLALRRFGLEVLGSPEVLVLAGLGPPKYATEDRLLRVPLADRPVVDRAVDVCRYRAVGDESSASGDYATAADVYGRAVELLDQIRTSLLTGQASALVHSKEYASAVKRSGLALQSEPDNARALYLAGYALKAQGLLIEARSMLLRAVESEPHFVAAMQSLADVHMQQREFRAAVEVYDRMLAVEPGHDLATNNRTAALEELAAAGA